MKLGARRLELRACRDDVVRVLDAAARAPSSAASRSITVAGACQPTAFEVKPRPDGFELATKRLVVRVAMPDGRLSFRDHEGRMLLAEKEGGARSLEPAEVMGEKTAHVQAEFEHDPGEAFYGLGAHQNGLMNYAGRDVDMYQLNIVDVVPFLVSSRGYGLLWDNTSHTKFGDRREPRARSGAEPLRRRGQAGRPHRHLPPGRLRDRHGRRDARRPADRVRRAGGPAGDLGDPQRAAGREPRAPPQARAGRGLRHLGRRDRVRGRGRLRPDDVREQRRPRSGSTATQVFGTWRQGWLPWWDEARLQVGSPHERHKLRLEWHRDEGEGTLRLKWKTPPRSPYTSLWSEVGDGIDYYFVYGPELDDVVAGYRKLTGQAPLMPRWALGLWQSRERYKTAKEVTDTLAEFRKRGIPLDTIVMDWQYWKPDQWGSHQFDPERFPDPAGWLREIHERWNAKLMISVWPKFYTTTDNFKAMQARGFLYPETLKRPTTDWLGHVHTFYDAFNPEARKLFWQQMNEALFSKGVDAWWMDATEPELVGEGTPGALKAAMNPTALGSGARMANAYVLASSQAVYEGQRGADPEQARLHPHALGLRGQPALRRGHLVGRRLVRLGQPAPADPGRAQHGALRHSLVDDRHRRLRRRRASGRGRIRSRRTSRSGASSSRAGSSTRPSARCCAPHGQFPYREMWNFGGEDHQAYRTQLAFDQLRYRMLPYTYSLAAAVTRHDAMLMRPLVAEFRQDPAVRDIGDEFLFGPSILVNPVTSPGDAALRLPAARRRPAVSPVTAPASRGARSYLPRDPSLAARATRDGWYDFWTGAFKEAGRASMAPAPYESLPVFVRAGSILPMGPELQYTAEKPADPLTLWVYTGRDAHASSSTRTTA